MTHSLQLTATLATAALGLVLNWGASGASAQPVAPGVTRPVYRVAESTPPKVDTAVTPAATAQPVAAQPPGLEGSPFDLRQRPGEHPLMPCLRLAKQGLAEMNAGLRCYSGTLTKTELIDGQVVGPQAMNIRVQQKPFAVHMKFVNPFPGREVLYNSGLNKTKLTARGDGWKWRMGKMELDVNGAMAMNGQRYPITMTGLYNLTAELVKVAEQDVKYGECTVSYSTQYKVDGRPTTMIETVHPTPRRNFRYNIARIYIDHGYRVPTKYSAWTWPKRQGGQPLLEEEYTYTNLKLNPALTAADFDPSNPALFSKK
ncbi:MAG: DUF1571 domain-containing protein [Planctomycetota bacterium]